MDGNLSVFEFIRKLAYDFNCHEKFIQNVEFLKTYHKFTRMLAELDTEDALLRQFSCLTSWFALFARSSAHDDKEKSRNRDRNSFSIDTLITEFDRIFMNLEQKGAENCTQRYCTGIQDDLSVLYILLHIYYSDSNCLAANTGEHYYNLAKKMCMENIEAELDTELDD